MGNGKKAGFTLLFGFVASALAAQAAYEVPEADPDRAPKRPSWKAGVETDLLAWRIGELFESCYLGVWTGPAHWKFGLTGAAMELNPGHLPDGVAKDFTWLAQLKADWSPSADRMGFWIGPSLLYERLLITSVKAKRSELSALSAGLNTGYLLKSDRFYFGPSLAVHFTLGSPSFALDDDATMPLPPWSFETGFRFGYAF